MLNEILKNFGGEILVQQVPRVRSDFYADDHCENCEIGIEWRPHSNAEWNCLVCNPPPDEIFARYVRMPIFILKDLVLWETVLPKSKIEISEIEFEQLPAGPWMTREQRTYCRQWMNNCGVDNLTLDRIAVHNLRAKERESVLR